MASTVRVWKIREILTMSSFQSADSDIMPEITRQLMDSEQNLILGLRLTQDDAISLYHKWASEGRSWNLEKQLADAATDKVLKIVMPILKELFQEVEDNGCVPKFHHLKADSLITAWEQWEK
jgi:hypothetical protein